MAKRGIPPTVRGYNTYEVVSAYQKAIRRSNVDDALYWGAELFKSGFHNWAWKRLRVIVSEDIGPAAPGLPADVRALYESEPDHDNIMFFAHATILAARAPKSRIVDTALFVVMNTDRPQDRDIPDEALDKHTLRGKQMGRGAGHFIAEASKLVQPDGLSRDDKELSIPKELLDLEDRYLQARIKEGQDKIRDPEALDLLDPEDLPVPEDEDEDQPPRLLP